jgi:hypothetical protein
MRTERSYDPRTSASYAWLARASALVNHFNFYCAKAAKAWTTAPRSGSRTSTDSGP